VEEERKPDRASTDPAEWQLARQLTTFRPEYPMSGFGPNGGHTLYATNPKPSTRMVFRGGKPVMEESRGCLDTPEIRALRDGVIASLRAVGADRIEVSTALCEYTAAVLRMNYDLSDDDLTLLMGHGTKWVKAAVCHVCGGDDLIEAMANIAPDVLMKFSPPPARDVPQEPTALVSPRPRGLKRLFNLFRR